MYNYNDTKHGRILMKPADMNDSNKNQIWITLYGYGLGDFPLPKFKVGDSVRISKYKSMFSRRVMRLTSPEEIFKVTEGV